MYSPKISEELVPVLYRIAKSEKKPMTQLVNKILKDELQRRNSHDSQRSIEDDTHQI